MRELQEQLEEEIEYSTEMYERAQLAEAELITLRASVATTRVSRWPSLCALLRADGICLCGFEPAKTCKDIHIGRLSRL